MTTEQKYAEVLKELGELLQSKNTTIQVQSWQIDSLKKQLAVAEAERDADASQIAALKTELAAAEEEIEQLKGGAA